MRPKRFNSVLLIDDDDINNFINQKVIQSLNITDEILLAKNGREALEVLQFNSDKNNFLPELIFVDINMPVMDGFEFIEKLYDRGLNTKYKTTIVILTTSTSPWDRDRFESLGIEFYINKPLTKEIVTRFINTLSLKNIKNTFAIPIIPPNEEKRIKAVKKYQILDTEPESGFNEIALEAATYFNVPIALVSIVDTDRVFFKANVGMPGVINADRGMSLCSLAILKDELTVFENASEDPCLLSNPLVHGTFGLKFYAGAPIINSEGFHIGTVCIVDKKPRPFSEDDKAKLRQLASVAMEKIEKRLISIQAE